MPLIFTDTHCHLDLDHFAADREDVLARARAAGVTRILVPSLNLVSSSAVLGLASKFDEVCAAIGLHPSDVADDWQRKVDGLHAIAQSPKVVAIGEIGLDYYWTTAPTTRALQRAALVAQLESAATLQLPVVLHCREEGDAAYGACGADLMAILREWTANLRDSKNPLARNPGVQHSFAGTSKMAEELFELGFLIGVTGPITFQNAHARREVIASAPLERILLETDAPFLTPVPHRGKRNEPAFIPLIADRIAQVKSRSIHDVALATTSNADRLFSWGASS